MQNKDAAVAGLIKKPLRILGIDPGYDRLGYAIVEEGRRPCVLASGCFETGKNLQHAERLHMLASFLPGVIAEFKPDAAAIETLFFSKNQTSALKVAEARGVILSMLQAAGIPITELNPMSVKVAITGHGGSDKQQVISMVQKLCVMKKTNESAIEATPKKRTKAARDDEFDAIAIGVAGLLSYPHERRMQKLLQK